MRFQEVMVVMRFAQEQPVTLEDVRAVVRGQGEVLPIQVCYGELMETPDAPWTDEIKRMFSMSQTMDKVLSTLR